MSEEEGIEEMTTDELQASPRGTKRQERSEDSSSSCDENREEDGAIEEENGESSWTVKTKRRKGRQTPLSLNTINDTTKSTHTSTTHNHTPKSTKYAQRKPMTEERRAELEELNMRTLFVKGEGRTLTAMFLSRPRTLKMELMKACKTEVAEITIIKDALRITCQNTTQKKLIKDSLTHIEGKPVEISEPYALPRQARTNETKPEPEYDLKVVIHGLLESDEILNEIASDIGAKYMRRIGGPSSKTVLVGFAKGTALLDTITIDGRRFRLHTYVPRPLRCRRCLRFSHHESICRGDIKCTRCGQEHSRTDCPDTATTKCINCAGPHSADDRKCPKYVTIQKALEIRAREKVNYREAYVLATQELNTDQEQMQTNTTDKEPNTDQEQIQTNTTDKQNTAETTIENEQETFTNLIKTSPYTINKTDKYKAPITEYTRITEIQTCRFVLGVLGALKNKNMSRTEVTRTIASAAGNLLHGGKLKFVEKVPA